MIPIRNKIRNKLYYPLKRKCGDQVLKIRFKARWKEKDLRVTREQLRESERCQNWINANTRQLQMIVYMHMREHTEYVPKAPG